MDLQMNSCAAAISGIDCTPHLTGARDLPADIPCWTGSRWMMPTAALDGLRDTFPNGSPKARVFLKQAQSGFLH